MNPFISANHHDIIKYINKTTCGVVYPFSIAENIQHGNVYIYQDSALFWHYSGFAFIGGACENHFLNFIYENFFAANPVFSIDRSKNISRRFILFASDQKTKDFFFNKNKIFNNINNIIAGKRYFFEYPRNFHDFSSEFYLKNKISPVNFTNFQIREINAELLDKLNHINGVVTPYFSWSKPSEFLKNGKGYCLTDGNIIAAWAFSAAVSSIEIDIGVETSAEYRRLGFGALVAGQMIKYCLEQNKRPVWACNSNNIASRKLAEKLGFIKISECDTFKKI